MSISNNPPAFEAFSLTIEELLGEANNFLDGEAIATQGQADSVGKLLTQLRTVKNDADTARADEKRPHDDASKAVQAKWKPLLDKCDTAVSVAKKALTPWLEKLEAEQRAEAEEKARVAEQARLNALEAERQAREHGSLEDAERAKEAIKVADIATKAAAKADKAKAHATGGARAVSLRASWTAEVTDPLAFGRWLWTARKADYLEWLDCQAEELTRTRPAVPGIIYHEQRSVV